MSQVAERELCFGSVCPSADTAFTKCLPLLHKGKSIVKLNRINGMFPLGLHQTFQNFLTSQTPSEENQNRQTNL